MQEEIVDVNGWSRAFLPSSWTEAEGNALVVLYRAVRAPLTEGDSEPYCFDVGDVRVTLFWASPSIPNVQTLFWFVEPNQLQWFVNQNGEQRLAEGRYCLLAARSTEVVTRADARAAIDAARGLLYAFHGPNIAYMKIFELVVGLASPGIELSTPIVDNPFSLPAPKLLSSERESFSRLARRIESQPAPDHDRLDLSLRWFVSAVPLWGPDAFLHYWIALEALAMPDSTNIRPVNEHLAHAYGVDLPTAVAEFKVGRLFRFRGAVVHDGSQKPVPGDVLRYLAAIYVDVLLDVLDLPAEGRARKEWQSYGPVINTFLGIRADA